MKIMQGWSGETERNVWSKADITLDETDLLRLLREHAIHAEITDIPTNLTFDLLSAEAQLLLFLKLNTRYGRTASAETQRRIEQMRLQRKDAIDAIRDHLSTRVHLQLT